jgi:DNA mismatch repair protein MutS2
VREDTTPAAGAFDLEALEFDGVRSLLAARARTPMGRARAMDLVPSPDPDEVAHRNALLGERIALDADGRAFALRLEEDPAPALASLGPEGAVLEAADLRALLSLAVAARAAALSLRAVAESAPCTARLAAGIGDLGPLLAAAQGVFAPDGGIEDGASPRLAALRRQAQTTSERLRRRLEALVSDPESAGFLQDEFVTLRGNRFVVPVRADSRAALKGIVHGASTSGQTLFVEPLETVELNNTLVRVREEEAAEIRRILASLSAAASRQRHDLEQAADILGRIDLAGAAARLGADFGMAPALPSDDGRLVLEDTRHLLLEDRLRAAGTSAVPLTVRLGEGDRVLVISGPNTGGKTVALKSIGLAALMHQAGLPVPAAESVLPVFRQVLADIGDHQSIAENLSTFSSHVLALVRMTRRVDAPALVLLDELGAGTDPEEGGALGVAVVEHFRTAGARVILTTHHNRLKAYAAATPGVLNASVEFDETRLAPTYRLLVGSAGRSGGLDIAERLGLPRALVEDARGRLSEGARLAERYAARLAAEVASAEQDRRAAAEDRVRARQEMEEAGRERERLEAEAAREIGRRLGAAETRFESTLAGAMSELKALSEAAKRRAETRARAEVARTLRAAAAEIAEPRPSGEITPSLAPGVGDTVLVRSLRRSGVVERIGPAGTLTVDLGGIHMEVRSADVEAVPPGRATPPARRATPEADEPVEEELRLLGLTVEEALDRLDCHLDRAVIAGWDRVRVVHGHGTGRLKRAVRDALKRHPAVETFRPGEKGEGGDGATVVRIRR